VPDCSHSGLCSECGVCGEAHGHNVVHPPPPIPPFEGHYSPNIEKAQRVRIRFSKVRRRRPPSSALRGGGCGVGGAGRAADRHTQQRPGLRHQPPLLTLIPPT